MGEPEAPEDDRMGMTEEQWVRFQADTSGYGDQNENGYHLLMCSE